MGNTKKTADYAKLKELIHAAIGPERTQSGFADEAGISRSQMSKLLNGSNGSVPNISTLSKISGHAYTPVSLRSLMSACGYPENVIEEKNRMEKREKITEREKMNPDDRMFALCKDLEDRMKADRKESGFISVKEPADYLLQIQEEGLLPEDFSFEFVSDILPYTNEDIPGAEQAIIAEISFETDTYISSFLTVFFLCSTKSGRCLLLNLSCNPDLIKRLSPDLASDYMVYENSEGEIKSVSGLIEWKEPKHKTDGFMTKAESDRRFKERYDYYRNEKGMNRADAVMAAIGFDDDGRPKRIACCSGYGFWLDEVPKKKLYDFLLNHENEFLHPEKIAPFYEKLKATTYNDPDLWKWFDENNYFAEDERHAGSAWYGAAIANIIYFNTGIGCDAMDTSENDREYPYCTNRPVLMFAGDEPWMFTETEKNLSRETLEQILDEYAYELGTEVHEVWYYYEWDA